MHDEVIAFIDTVLSDEVKLEKNPIVIVERNPGANNTEVKFNSSLNSTSFYENH